MTKGPIWYAAHAVMYFKTGKNQRIFLLFENVYLVKARSPTEVRRIATRLARAGVSRDGSDRVNGKPATCEFGGIRKIIECMGDATTFRPAEVRVVHQGMEATYSIYTVRGRKALRAFARGDAVDVAYQE